MATKFEELEKFQHGQGCLGKADDDEPIFILRAQDALAADLVEQWAIRAGAVGCPHDKVFTTWRTTCAAGRSARIRIKHR